MSEYRFNSIRLIAETFIEKDVKFRVNEHESSEDIEAGFGIDNGPSVSIRFISRDEDNDVAVRLFALINSVSEAKRSRVLALINDLNRKLRFLKFNLDSDGDVNIEYDMPLHAADDCLGEMAHELFVHMAFTVRCEYGRFMKALYADDADSESSETADDSGETSFERLRRILSEYRTDRNAEGGIPSFEEFRRAREAAAADED